jgi:hypothetical protein
MSSYFGFQGWYPKPREPLPDPTITRAGVPVYRGWKGRWFDAYDVEVEVDVSGPISTFPLDSTIDVLATRFGDKAKEAELIYVYQEFFQVREWNLEEVSPAFDFSSLAAPPHPNANPSLRGSIIRFPKPLTGKRTPWAKPFRLGMSFYFTVTKEPPWRRRFF